MCDFFSSITLATYSNSPGKHYSVFTLKKYLFVLTQVLWLTYTQKQSFNGFMTRLHEKANTFLAWETREKQLTCLVSRYLP